MEQEPTDEEVFSAGFGKAVKAAREAAGLTQRELAEKADLADKYLSRVEVGAATPSVYVAMKIAKALQIPLDILTNAATSGERAEIAAVVQLLEPRSAEEIDRVLRVVREMLR